MSSQFNKVNVEKILARATELAEQMQHEYVVNEHIVAALLERDEIKEMITSIGGDLSSFTKKLDSVLKDHREIPKKANPANRTRASIMISTWFQKLAERVVSSQRLKIEFEDMFLQSVTMVEGNVGYIAANSGITPLKIKEYISHGRFEEDEEASAMNPFAAIFGQQEKELSGKLTKDKAIKLLKKYCKNLNEEASNGKIDPLIGRENEILALCKTTKRRRKNNTILVGDPGVGKTQIVEGLAKLIIEKKVPESLQNSTIWSLDVGSLLAGTKFRGDFEERLKNILLSLEFLSNTSSPILFIDEMQMILGAGAGGEAKSMDMSNLLKPSLTKGIIRFIGSTTFDEYQKHIEKDKALLRRFNKLDVSEPSIEDSIKILNGIKKYYEDYHKVSYTKESIEAAVKLTAKYMNNRKLPDKAIDIIDVAGAKQNILPTNKKDLVITVSHIEAEVSELAKIPPQSVKEDETQNLAGLAANLKSKIFGQDDAIEQITNSVLVSRSGFKDPQTPVGVFLLNGPTGVGKTQVAVDLASLLGTKLIKFDMSEYQEKHSVARLIGSPPGYVGHDDTGGLLIEALEKNPTGVILFDEGEKAHPDVMNILLQLFDYGEITNSKGKTVYGREAIFIISSNLGASMASKGSIGFGRVEYDETKTEEAVKKHFAPEFLNRLTAIITFNKLTKENIKLIVDKFINQLNVDLLTNGKMVTIKLDDAAKELLADKGFDPLYGARPMKRTIHNLIKTPLSTELLFGKLVNGGTVNVGAKNNQLTFKIRPKVSKNKQSVEMEEVGE